jgi:uncharacterized protein (DUF433 family)
MEATRLKSEPIIRNGQSKTAPPRINWSQCALVEVNPRKVSGVPIVKGTRVQADSIVENFEGGSPIEEISENFSIPESTIRALLNFAGKS